MAVARPALGVGALLLVLASTTIPAPTVAATPISSASQEVDTLIGAWHIVEARTIAPGGEVHPGSVSHSLLLFDGRYYSITWAGGAEPSPPFAERFSPTEEEMLERYKRIVFNAGTYVVEGSALRVKPHVALVPEFIGGEGVFELRFEGERLELTWIDNWSADGIQDPYTKVGVRWQYVLERVRDDGQAR